ncbi:sensor histidine kinase [Hydrogenophaga sp.]|uniref:sensor histidine kinase n=1 Tax=Hydrogenophaga sp. TaxID=1904254 RepID=UPI003BB192AC
MPAINWFAKLRHFLQVMGFALTVATLQYAFMPERPYGPPLVYSLLIATLTWAVIDLGRDLFPSAAETGWPKGHAGLALVLGGIVFGYLGGTTIADAVCRYFQWYPPGTGQTTSELRNSILITALAGFVGSFYFYAVNKGAYLERKMAEARHQASEARLKLLESQLEPHMLFNTLANLRALIGTDPARATAMLDRLNDYLRATLTASRTDALSGRHTLAEEFARLRDYLELMAVRMGPRLRYTLELPEALSAQPVPPLLLQPLVENCIRHGLEPSLQGGEIRVAARQGAAGLELEVSDTGVGCRPTPEPGFGLSQVRERIATAYAGQAHMDWHSQPGSGTCARLTLPLHTP